MRVFLLGDAKSRRAPSRALPTRLIFSFTGPRLPPCEPPRLLRLRGLGVARVRLFFPFKVGGDLFSCALIHRFCKSFDDLTPTMAYGSPNTILIATSVGSHLSYMWTPWSVPLGDILPVFRGDVVVPRKSTSAIRSTSLQPST
ncbi:hypothetical protein BDM02DRAFT_493270 [Thelephora ganbajun]|uniref:Uncharacterized protein n=1 Tax=Thelephora ganbajun TaxID=370292 RepID=A0ACB6Z790_THEGA|nr:hypothetical protein BDM02DRAFT_493270 [Thelephora ganbajun]